MQKKDNNLKILSYLCLGSNLGESRRLLAEALLGIAALPDTEIVGRSRFYLTEPQEESEQPWFLNIVAAVLTNLPPLELLHALQGIERGLGRKREASRRFGPRSVDIDILYCEGVEMNTPELTLPHPRLWNRAFALVPLTEISSGPFLESVKKALEKLSYRLENDKIFQSR